LGGGGTDLPSYYKNNGGMVISMAINKYMYITLKPDEFENLYKIRYSEIESVSDPTKLKHSRARECLLLHKISGGIEINSCADLSANSGLGSSGTFLVGLLKGIREYKRLNVEPEVVADEACRIEIDILNEPVGKQDQYIASYGGIRIFEINKDGKVSQRNLKLSNFSEFIQNTHVYSLNVKRNASDILKEQNKMSGNTQQTLDRVKEYGYKTLEILESGNYDEYGLLLDKYWTLKKSLSNQISISFVDEIYEEAKQKYGVLGGKIIGAGGGGFIMLYCPKEGKKLQQFMEEKGMWRLNYSPDYTGSRVIGNFLENNVL
jgi:D-glycero-alpha-D-manno-heptose-7-phosphate kinase